MPVDDVIAVQRARRAVDLPGIRRVLCHLDGDDRTVLRDDHRKAKNLETGVRGRAPPPEKRRERHQMPARDKRSTLKRDLALQDDLAVEHLRFGGQFPRPVRLRLIARGQMKRMFPLIHIEPDGGQFKKLVGWMHPTEWVLVHQYISHSELELPSAAGRPASWHASIASRSCRRQTLPTDWQLQALAKA